MSITLIHKLSHNTNSSCPHNYNKIQPFKKSTSNMEIEYVVNSYRNKTKKASSHNYWQSTILKTNLHKTETKILYKNYPSFFESPL